MYNLMTSREFRKALKNCKFVFAWVVIAEHDGAYLQVTKESCKVYTQESGAPKNERYIKAVLRNDGDLYID